MERRLKPRLVLLLVLAYVGTFAARHTARPQIARPLLALRGGAKPYTRETAALLAWKLRTAKEPKAPPPRSVGLRNAGIAINLVLWWTLNVVFNLANKGGTGYNKEGETSPICPNGWCVKSYSLMVCGSASPLDPEKGLGEHNYCRNPTADPGGIWCYTDAMNTKKEACAPSLLTGSIVGGKG